MKNADDTENYNSDNNDNNNNKSRGIDIRKQIKMSCVVLDYSYETDYFLLIVIVMFVEIIITLQMKV